MDNTTRMEEVQTLGQLIKDIRFAMLVTEDAEGRLHARPMATQSGEFDGTLWFFTKDDAPKCKEVVNHREVNVCYSDEKTHRYVSVAGRAEVLFDRDKAEELWHPMLRSYFPEGLEDPHLALLKVEVHSAQYWETPEGPARRIMGAAKAMFTGEQHIPGTAKRIELGRTG